jgi:hypothetical protein
MKRETAVNVSSRARRELLETDRERFSERTATAAGPLARALARGVILQGRVPRNVIAALLLPWGISRRRHRPRGDGALPPAASPRWRKRRPIRDAKAARKAMEERVDRSFAELSAWWKDRLSVLTVKTPDPALDSMVNVHNPRQCLTTNDWSRYLSFYQLGYGSDRGIGFRDSSQDCMGVLPLDAAGARSLMEKLLSVQRRNGSAYHQFNPLTMEAGVGDSKEYEDRPKYYGDDHLWIVLAITAYLKETATTLSLRRRSLL